ncbi:MAG: WD40 repeat domain-containing protein [Anaerolineae bacterium]|nr:WD40 repeat domain-containing protein [Anaerolineae bacterium]
MRRRFIGLIVGIAVIDLLTGGQGIRAQDDGNKPLVPITLDNVGQLEQIELLGPDQSVITSVEFSRRNPDLLAFGSSAGYTYLWKFGDSKVTKFEYQFGPIVDVAFNPELDYLASARPDLFALVWDIDPPKLSAAYGTGSSILTVAFSLDGYTLAFGGEDRIHVSDFESVPGGGFIGLQRIDTNEGPDAFYVIEEDSGQINSLAYSPDGIHIAAGIGGGNSIEPGGRVKIWNLETMMASRTLKGHTGAVLDVKYDSTGMLLASASADHTIRLWELELGRLVMTFLGHTDEVNAVAFSPDGTLLASVGSDGTLRFWDVATGEEVSIIDLTDGDTENPVWDVDFSADGTMVATASEDGFVRLWAVKGE